MNKLAVLLGVVLLGGILQAVVPESEPHIVAPEPFQQAVLLVEFDDDGIATLNDLFVAFAKIGSNEGIRQCLVLGVDVNVTTTKWLTALMAAAKYGHVDTVKLLIDKGADVNAANEFGITALMYAAKNGFTDIIHVLCDHGAKVNAVCYYAKWSALIFAVSEKQDEAVAALLAYPAIEINFRDFSGQTAMSIAENNGSTRILAMLRAHGQRRHGIRWCWPFVMYAS